MPIPVPSSSHSRTRHPAPLYLLITLLVATGCGSGTKAGEPAPPAVVTPDVIALRYVKATFSENPSSARSLVEPASQDAYKIVELGIGQQQLTSRDLQVGSTKIDGDRATVVMMGTLCRSAPTQSTPAADCITNQDPRSGNPIFQVFLTRQQDQSWLVSLRTEQSGVPEPEQQPGSSSSSVAPR